MATITRALISVSNKEGIIEFAKELAKLDIEIVSTGGTATSLAQNGIKVVKISDLTGHPEILEGRVKTLHPKVHGGILFRRDIKEHVSEIKEHKIKPIDMVVCNLYPFKETISKKGVDFDTALENIDIGGPSMIRSAAKNCKHVAVVVDPAQYPKIAEELKKNKNKIGDEMLTNLALEAFKHTAQYDSIICDYFREKFSDMVFPDILNLTFEKLQELRYGENPHQKGAFYRETFLHETSVTNAKQLHGKELSYNNILDLDAAFELIKDFSEPTAAVIKHNNPCGVASRKTIEEAYTAAHEADPLSAFGCVVALNRPCNLKVAKYMKPLFIEAVIAPGFDKDALALLEQKKNVRLLETGAIIKSEKGYNLRKVAGGLLVQTRNWPEPEPKEWKVVTKRKPTAKEIKDMVFCWKVNKHVKSNAVIFAKDLTTVGIGAGQMSRVDSSMIAAKKAKEKAKGAVVSSDAFFPFRDGVDETAKSGITAIVQPGGSIRDKEVIDAANEHGIAMVFTGVRLFKH